MKKHEDVSSSVMSTTIKQEDQSSYAEKLTIPGKFITKNADKRLSSYDVEKNGSDSQLTKIKVITKRSLTKKSKQKASASKVYEFASADNDVSRTLDQTQTSSQRKVEAKTSIPLDTAQLGEDRVAVKSQPMSIHGEISMIYQTDNTFLNEENKFVQETNQVTQIPGNTQPALATQPDALCHPDDIKSLDVSVEDTTKSCEPMIEDMLPSSFCISVPSKKDESSAQDATSHQFNAKSQQAASAYRSESNNTNTASKTTRKTKVNNRKDKLKEPIKDVSVHKRYNKWNYSQGVGSRLTNLNLVRNQGKDISMSQRPGVISPAQQFLLQNQNQMTNDEIKYLNLQKLLRNAIMKNNAEGTGSSAGNRKKKSEGRYRKNQNHGRLLKDITDFRLDDDEGSKDRDASIETGSAELPQHAVSMSTTDSANLLIQA